MIRINTKTEFTKLGTQLYILDFEENGKPVIEHLKAMIELMLKNNKKGYWTTITIDTD